VEGRAASTEDRALAEARAAAVAEALEASGVTATPIARPLDATQRAEEREAGLTSFRTAIIVPAS
jgi:outer membrane protein OmpA-like peptidoglycan-associated protein